MLTKDCLSRYVFPFIVKQALGSRNQIRNSPSLAMFLDIIRTQTSICCNRFLMGKILENSLEFLERHLVLDGRILTEYGMDVCYEQDSKNSKDSKIKKEIESSGDFLAEN
jgi:hypothetical protein